MAQPLRVDYDGRMADAYDDGRCILPEAERAWLTTVAPYVRQGALLIDMGAGTGRFARLFVDRLGARVIAVEPATGMRRRARSADARGPLEWVAGRAEAVPLRSGVADVVWLCCVLHYLDLPVAGVELARVLTGNGKLLVRSVFPDRFDHLEWLRWFPSARRIDEERMPSVEQVENTWSAAGFTLDARVAGSHLAARDLKDLADRLEHRAISTLELISDEEFSAGLAALRDDARRTPAAPVYSPVDILVFSVHGD